ncbi:hypothetical protein OF846_002309 [Rhodotorula toruloides]|nr:hypothetical protein OF846_002309 [Rhodotorula toruloides]
MQLPSALVVLLSLASLSHALPMARQRPSPRDIKISHTSLANGTTSTHSIANSVLPAELQKAIEGSDININLTTDRVKRAAGVNNSSINLTVISSRALLDRKTQGDALRRDRTTKRAAPASSASSSSAPQHHNIHIDASSNGAGGVGGIHNSTVNINLHSTTTSRKTRRKVALGDHSVLVDVSSFSSAQDGAEDGGIEDSTVHVNILPPRALTKSTGHHSIVVDSSSLSSEDAAQSSTTTGSHSAVVDTSAGPSSSASGVKNSTINLTVIAPKDSSSSPADAEVPSLARLSKRALPAFEAWSSSIQQRDVASPSEDVPALVGRDHSSRASMKRIVKRA